MTQIAVGTRIYNAGDMANPSHFGVVISRMPFGDLCILADDGHRYFVAESSFSAEYRGHCGTRLVTEAAYRRWRSGQIALLSKIEGEI